MTQRPAVFSYRTKPAGWISSGRNRHAMTERGARVAPLVAVWRLGLACQPNAVASQKQRQLLGERRAFRAASTAPKIQPIDATRAQLLARLRGQRRFGEHAVAALQRILR